VHGAAGHLRAEHFQQPGEAVGAQVKAGLPGADRVEPAGTGAVEPPRVGVCAAPGPPQPAPRVHQGGEAGEGWVGGGCWVVVGGAHAAQRAHVGALMTADDTDAVTLTYVEGDPPTEYRS